MKRAAIFTISIALLLLSWAALDDITTGTEPSLVLEWIVVSLTFAWFAAPITARIRRPTQGRGLPPAGTT